MRYRPLGQTGLRVSEIGFGTEHLVRPRASVVEVVAEALDAGVNYFDVLLSDPEYRDTYGAAFMGRRDNVVIAGHLGNAWVNGQSITTRDPALSEASLHDLLTRLRIDAVDVLMLQYVDEQDDYARLTGPDGLLVMAQRLKAEGKARCIGMSSHMTPTARAAVESGLIDVLMFSINPAFDRLPGYLPRLEAMWEASLGQLAEYDVDGRAKERTALYHACQVHGVGLVAMKPFGAGFLLRPEQPHPLTPVQCLQYALDQPGVSTVAAGFAHAEQLRAALRVLDASPAERDYGAAIRASRWAVQGLCMYCNHCLPCPAGIDIAATVRLIDTARHTLTPTVRDAYHALPAHAADCTHCGDCMTRCPFQVDVVAAMTEGAALFAV